jgi:uncharacterized protein (TIGR03435 family)
MSTLPFLAEWALRSSILILSGALLLQALRVKDPSIRLAAWTAMLGGSLALPALTAALPSAIPPLALFRSSMPQFAMPHVAAQLVEAPAVVNDAAPSPMPIISHPDDGVARQDLAAPQEARVSDPFDWERAVFAIYLLVVGVLMLRSFAGLAMSLRWLHNSRATGQETEGIEIRESDRVAAPVTLGIVRPAILLPIDWCEWNGVKLEAVLAHERSHVRRRDPAVQLLSVIHRTLLWYSPLSWFLHKRIVQAAEEASDDAAVAATHDRASYAEVLLDFMRRGVPRANWRGADCDGVAMARYGLPEKRIDRILDATALSRGVTRGSVITILALGSPLAYVVATAQPQSVPQVQTLIAQAQMPIKQAQGPIAPQAPTAPVSPAVQSTAVLPAFDIADVHVSAPTGYQALQGPVFHEGRYELRKATMLDLIKIAYGVDADTVFGGPSWLETDRFDVIAKAPSATSPERIHLMLRVLLVDRFKLVLRKDTRPIQGFVLSVGSGTPKLKPADGSGEPGCQIQPFVATPNAPTATRVVSCHNVTMEAFAQSLQGLDKTGGIGGGYLHGPVLDSTGLKGAWDFDLTWTLKGSAALARATDITIYDALDKQLGLKLEPGKVPMPVLIVDSANQKPSANPPGVTTALPPAPPPKFEMASIQPSKPGGPAVGVGELRPDGRYEGRGIPLSLLIMQAWDVNTTALQQIPGMPQWMTGRNQPRFDIVAKAPATANTSWPQTSNDDLRMMLRALLVDRFKMAAHYEDRLEDGYTLVAAKPKLNPAEPSNRTGCSAGPSQAPRNPADGPPPAVPPLTVTCQKVTMAQFAERLKGMVSPYTVFRFPVLDSSGIAGAWDFTFTYNIRPLSAQQIAALQALTGRGGPAAGGGPPASAAPVALPDPTGILALSDALEEQLGLKLEMHQRPEPVFVVDHIEEKPTDN